jgi:hypothetical protein
MVPSASTWVSFDFRNARCAHRSIPTLSPPSLWEGKSKPPQEASIANHRHLQSSMPQ